MVGDVGYDIISKGATAGNIYNHRFFFYLHLSFFISVLPIIIIIMIMLPPSSSSSSSSS